jgi:hypothetical protein
MALIMPIMEDVIQGMGANIEPNIEINANIA